MRLTLEEIAKIAGVSKATVSRVINNVSSGVGEETRKHVQQVLTELHYSNGSDVQSMRSKSLALILPDITNPFFADLARSVARKAITENYVVILVETEFSKEKEQEYISKLISKKVDGIVLVPSARSCTEAHFLPERYHVPMVLLDRKLDGAHSYSGVYSDNEYASFMCCERLIKSGAKEIAFISGPLDVSTSTERMVGYKDALRHYGIPFDTRRVRIGNYTVESGYQAILDLEKENLIYSAVLAANDLMALGALRAMKEFSYKIPEEKQIIGFDNIDFSKYCEPPLSTVQQPSIQMGAQAVELLLAQINGEKISPSIRLQPKMLYRKTTKFK